MMMIKMMMIWVLRHTDCMVIWRDYTGRNQIGTSKGRWAPPLGEGRLYGDRGVYMRKGAPPRGEGRLYGETGAYAGERGTSTGRGAPPHGEGRLNVERGV